MAISRNVCLILHGLQFVIVQRHQRAFAKKNAKVGAVKMRHFLLRLILEIDSWLGEMLDVRLWILDSHFSLSNI